MNYLSSSFYHIQFAYAHFDIWCFGLGCFQLHVDVDQELETLQMELAAKQRRSCKSILFYV